MIARLLLTTALLTLGALASNTQAQGSQRVLGGGCRAQIVPTVQGPLAIGTINQLVDSGCFIHQGGTAVLMIGIPLPQSQWIPIPLNTGIGQFERCDLVAIPIVFFDTTRLRLPWNFQIPLDPSLRGQALSMQFLCEECAFAGCFPAMSKGIEILIG